MESLQPMEKKPYEEQQHVERGGKCKHRVHVALAKMVGPLSPPPPPAPMIK